MCITQINKFFWEIINKKNFSISQNQNLNNEIKTLTKNKKIYIIYKASRKIIYNGGVKMKRTYQPNNHRKSKKLGFMARMKTKMINNRRRKGRKVLSH